MVKAFVFGKYYPFHKGHEAIINFALTKCDYLTVLICCSDKEIISDVTRKYWIENCFPHAKNLEIRTYNYLEHELPNTSKSSKEVSRIWADIFIKQFPDYSLLITSEDYGNFVSDFMNIQHIKFDSERNFFPVSSTLIRNDLFKNWRFLPDSVKPYFVIKVVILGTESTGKTTLTNKLSQHYNCSKVLEAGREIIANSNSFSFSDLHLVAEEHANQINKAPISNSPLIIIDTDINITKSYGRFVFDEELVVSNKIEESNRANLYLYLNNDVSFFQDGTRLDETDRNLLDYSHKQILAENKIEFVEISGNWDVRFTQAVSEINKLFKPDNNRWRNL